MSRRSSYQGALRLSVATSIAALTAACSQSYGPEQSSRNGGLMVSRSLFTEGDYGVRSSPRVVASQGPVAKGGGRFKLGSPYKVAGRWYVPREDFGYDRQGIGSWYGDDFHGRKTANGEIFDKNGLTAAHPTMPLPSYAYVTNLDNGRTVLVRVNDRGPYVGGRIIDLSYASARVLGYAGHGKGRVRVRYAGRAPLNGDDRRERQFLAEQSSGGGRRFASVPEQRLPRQSPQNYQPAPASGWTAATYRAERARKPNPEVTPQRLSQRSDDTSAPVYAPVYAPATGIRVPEQSSRAYIDIGIYRDRGNAEVLRRDLGALGPVEVAPLETESGEFYRVRLGPIPANDAERTVADISQRGLRNTRVVFD